MIIFTSPAKTFSDTSVRTMISKSSYHSLPPFIEHANELAAEIKTMTIQELADYLDVSDSLAEQNFARYSAYDATGKADAYPALLMYAGDVFSQLSLDEYDSEEWNYATSHVMVLSGLYGIVRGMDLIQEYRLEMKSDTPSGADRLHRYWQMKITDWLKSHLDSEEWILQLASNEYIKAVDTDALGIPVVDITFEQQRKGSYKTYGLLAKRARGAMIDYCIQHKVEELESIKAFDLLGYTLVDESDNQLLFRSDSH